MGAYSLFTFSSKRSSPYKIQLSVARRQALEMKVYTGLHYKYKYKRTSSTNLFQKAGHPSLRSRNGPPYRYLGRGKPKGTLLMFVVKRENASFCC